MTGRAEVARLKQRLDGAFARFDLVGPDLEVRADFARYLCVLVSGYLEQAIRELATEHCRLRAQRTVVDYVMQQLRRFQNPKTEAILTLVSGFDASWRGTAEAFIVDDRKTAVDSIVNVRHQIAHGENVGATFSQIHGYYQSAQEVVDFLADLFVPA